MSAAAGASHAATSPPRYFCHKCERTVSVTPAADGELYCTVCNNSFVEEMENPNPNIPSSPFIPASPLTFLFGGPPFSGSPLSGGSFSGGPFSFDVRSPSDLSGLFGGDPAAHAAAAASPSAGPEPFNPFAFIQNHLHDLTSNGGSIQFVIDGSPGVGGAANLGDYFFGSGLEQLIQQLAENDPNRYGTPPASKSAVESLPNVAVSQHLMDSGEAQCAVCMDDFEVGAEGKQMPCKHLFHKDCILPWLALHNSCPVCRFELPTDDPDYEHRVRGAPAPIERVPAGSGSAGGPATARTDGRADARANATGPRVIERRFRITLPWPFQGLGQNGEGGDNGNDSSGAGWDTNFDGR